MTRVAVITTCNLETRYGGKEKRRKPERGKCQSENEIAILKNETQTKVNSLTETINRVEIKQYAE